MEILFYRNLYKVQLLSRKAGNRLSIDKHLWFLNFYFRRWGFNDDWLYLLIIVKGW